jgi:hypothetical protein
VFILGSTQRYISDLCHVGTVVGGNIRGFIMAFPAGSPGSRSESLETILAERDIYRALVGFARAMDARDWHALDTITTEDMTADLGVGSLLSGRVAIVACMRSFLDACGPTQHLLGNVLIDVQADSASSRAYVSDMHLGTGDKSSLRFCTLGDYHDQWKKTGDGWRMSHREKINNGYVGSFDVLGSGPDGWR